MVDEDALSVLYDVNVKPHSFDREFKALLSRIEDTGPQADIIVEMAK